ncbi:hypothetical protein VTI74DRAFT_823 [Chaetomium olivicolor]
MYVSVDKQVLSEVGITVLDDPRAWLEVDDGSVVVSIAPDIPVPDIIADIARSAAMIMMLPPDWKTDRAPRVWEMLTKEYVKMEFFEHECFKYTTVFVKE